MFGTGTLDAGTLLGLGAVLAAIALGLRVAAARGIDPLPVPLLAGLVVSAVGPLDGLRPDPGITRAGAEIFVVVLLFGLGSDHSPGARVTAAATAPVRRLLAADALNAVPGVLFGLLAGFGITGAVLLGGATWASSWAVASRLLDREARFGNRETPAALAVLVLEHSATALYLPLAAALLAPGDAAARVTAALGSATAIAFAVWLLVAPPAPLRPGVLARLGLFDRTAPTGPGPGEDPAGPRTAAPVKAGPALALPLLLAGAALMSAGIAAGIGVGTAGVAYLAGVVLAGHLDRPAVRAVAVLRDLSAAGAGLALGLLVPAAKLPGAVAAGFLLAALSGATKIFTGWWAAGRLDAPVGRAGRLRAGLALVPRGELAVALGILSALSAPGRGPGTALAALVAVLVVFTTAAPTLVALVPPARRPGWYRWSLPTPAAVRHRPPGAR